MPNPSLPACHLTGRLEVGDQTLSFEIEESTCQAEAPGSVLERSILGKKEGEFSVKNADDSIRIRYTRRAP